MSNEKNLILSIYLCIDHWKRAGTGSGGFYKNLLSPRVPNVDPSFRDNRSQLEYFLNSIGATLKNDRVEKIVIRSYASPDGAVQANEQLAARRAEG